MFGVWGLLVACADLHAPPAAGQGGAPSDAGKASTSGAGSEPSPAASSAGSGVGGDAGTGSSSAGQTSGGSASLGGSSGASGSSGGASGGSAQGTWGGSSGASSSSGSSGGGGSNGGSAALGGSGGTAGVGGGGQGGQPACQSKTTGEVRAWLFPELADQYVNEIHPFVALTNTGSEIPLKELSLRYYFTAEMSGDFQTACIWVPKQSGGSLCGAGVSLKIVSVDPPRPKADHYLEVSFAGVADDTLSSIPTPVFEARSRFWRLGFPMANQANDYSFVPTTNEVMTVENRAYKATSKVTVYRNGALLWGEEPCP